MRRTHVTLALAFLTLFAFGQANAGNVNIRAEASPELAPGYIELGSNFTIDFYMTQNSGSNICGLSATWELNCPDGPLNVTHRDIGGHTTQGGDGTFVFLNGFEIGGAYWNAMNALRLDSWDGALPDTFNYTTIAIPLMPPYPCWPSDNTENMYIQVGFTAIEEGTLCIDSISHSVTTYDWLWSDPADPDFNGPYCWDIVSEVPPENEPPVVTDIPDQTISEGDVFATINLDDYVSDPDNSDAEMTWTATGNTDLTVDITDRVATIGIPDPEWSGSEIITFRATDPGDLFDEDAATFTVTAVNDAPVVTDIPDQMILEGETFATINLDDYVSDADNADAEMIWTATGNTDLTVDIVDRVATIIIPDENWYGFETITFRATDPGDLFDEDAATFTVTAVNDAP
ncbi:MAG: hypothetical protein JSV44_06720, partial [Candidatus Zixiibacteriota bacterium]